MSDQINREELTICGRRGHQNDNGMNHRWKQCGFCGTWFRSRYVREEREDEPPEEEQDEIFRLAKGHSVMRKS